MPLRSKSPTITERSPVRRLPARRAPTHPGEMLLEEFIRPMGITRAQLAARLEIPAPRLGQIVRCRRPVTPDTALRLARVLGMPAEFWLGLQADWDLWHAMNGPGSPDLSRLRPMPARTAKSGPAPK